jgi:hypothetical protein
VGTVTRRVARVFGASFFDPHFCRRYAPLGGIPAPANACDLEVYRLGHKYFSEGRHRAVWASPGVPEPPKRAPLEVGVLRGVRPRRTVRGTDIMFTKHPRSFRIARASKGRQQVGVRTPIAPDVGVKR